MKYSSIHNYFLAGMIMVSVLTIQGYRAIFNTEDPMIVLKIIYLFACGIVLQWYWQRYRFYRYRYVQLFDDKMVVHIDEDDFNILDKDIEGIFVLRHRYLFKIHPVIHMFTSDGEYFYFTKNINHFFEFKEELHDHYKNKYFERNETCSVDLVVTIENLYRLFFGDHKEVFEATEFEKHVAHYI